MKAIEKESGAATNCKQLSRFLMLVSKIPASMSTASMGAHENSMEAI